MRFTITWREGAYYVDVPEYEGGEVVTAQDYDHLDRVVADLHEQIRGLKADRQRPFLTLLREFLWSDEARDVTGSWGHDNKSGDEFRNELMDAAVAAALPTTETPLEDR